MRVELLLKGVGGEPLVVDATMVVVRLDDTTPILAVGERALRLKPGEPAAVAGAVGGDGIVRASHALDEDFNATLRALGINRTVICDKLVLPPPPPGARLVRGPETYLSTKDLLHG